MRRERSNRHCYPEPVTHKPRQKLSLNPRQQGTDGGQLITQLCVSTLKKNRPEATRLLAAVTSLLLPSVSVWKSDIFTSERMKKDCWIYTDNWTETAH